MANTQVGATVQVEFESIGQMRKAIKDATNDLIKMQEQFGKTSPQAIEAAKRIADLKDRIQDAKEQADLFDPGKRFSAFSNAASQIAAGFSAVQGAMALVGSESEDLQKTLVKVQGAIALSQGLSQLRDLGKAYDELKIVAVDAFKSIRAAIGSTGIGLLVIALGTIVAYWDEIKGAVSGVTEEQKNLNAEAEKKVKTSEKELENLNLQENSLRLQGKSEREILQLKIKATDEIIKSTEAQIAQNKITLKAQIEAAQRNKDILQGILTFISAPIAALLKGIDLIGDAVGKNFDLYNKFFGGISSFVFDPKQVEEEGKKALEEQDKALAQLKSQRDGYNVQIQNIDKAAAKKSADDKAKIDADRLKKQQEADKVLEDARLSKLTDQQREEEEAYKRFNERRLTLEAAGIKDFTAITEQGEIELAAIRKKYSDAEAERLKKEEEERIKREQDKIKETTDFLLKEAANDELTFLQRLEKIKEREALINEIKFNSEIEKTNFERENAQARIAIAEQEAQAKIAFTKDIGNALGTLSDIIGKETAAGKALAVAQATINTWLGVTEVLKQKSVLPEPAATISKVVNVASIVASGINAVRNIIKTQVPGGGGGGSVPSVAGGGGAPVAAQPTPTVTAQALNAQAINQLGNQGMRAYVLNSDITNNEQRNAYLQRNARIG